MGTAQCATQSPRCPLSDVGWFSTLGPSLDDETGDAGVRSLLSGSGEWLALAGEAEGHSFFHALHEVMVDRHRCVLQPLPKGRQGPVHVWAFDESAIVPNTVSYVRGLGLVWFEDNPLEGLRAHVHATGLTGIGFIKCWDDSGSFEYNTKWHIDEVEGRDIWS